jgi:hypothetical protein
MEGAIEIAIIAICKKGIPLMWQFGKEFRIKKL